MNLKKVGHPLSWQIIGEKDSELVYKNESSIP